MENVYEMLCKESLGKNQIVFNPPNEANHVGKSF
jgi:hypothetical protein